MLCWTVLRLQMVWADFGFLQRSWVRPGVVDIGQSCLDAAAAGAGDVLAPELLHWCIGTLVHCWRITACSCPWFWPMQWWFGAPSLLQKFSPSTSVLQEGHNPSPSAVISLKCLGIPGTMSLLPLQKNMEQCKGGWSKFAFGQFKVFGPELSTSKQTKNTSEIPKLYTCIHAPWNIHQQYLQGYKFESYLSQAEEVEFHKVWWFTVNAKVRQGGLSVEKMTHSLSALWDAVQSQRQCQVLSYHNAGCSLSPVLKIM